jgi:hypothetical protein
MRELIGSRRKRVVVGPVLRVLLKEVSHKSGVVSNGPVNSVCARVLHNLVDRFCAILQTARSILKHAEQVHVPRGASALAADLENMRVPGSCPLLGVLVDGVQEKMVKEPDVGRDEQIEAVVDLEVHEKLFPLVTKTVGHIVPQLFNTSVVHAPEQMLGRK